MLEVEQKFCVNTDYRDALKANNAVFVSEERLLDVYYDLPNLSFLKQDIWLRRRNHEKQIKIPISGQQHSSKTGGCTSYLEIAGDKVDEELKKLTDVQFDDLVILCTVDSTRENYTLNGFNIVIDHLKNSSYAVAEIELVASQESSLEEMQQQVKELGVKMGFSPVVSGKIFEALKTQNSSAYSVLRSMSSV